MRVIVPPSSTKTSQMLRGEQQLLPTHGLNVVIDGQPMSWEEFGKLWETHEGWQFRLTTVDRTEDV